jgi:uncharacterized protein YbbK (DUF523 family)
MNALPRVGISRCLLGDEVRYDGHHKYEPSLVETLASRVEWVAVCPEVEVGMGVPREPIHLVAPGGDQRVRLLGVTSETDWTERMQSWASERIATLKTIQVSGFVLKARSPSCGVRDVPVEGAATGRGMFADALLRAMPDLPVEDEERLRDPAVRESFLQRIAAYERNRD